MHNYELFLKTFKSTILIKVNDCLIPVLKNFNRSLMPWPSMVPFYSEFSQEIWGFTELSIALFFSFFFYKQAILEIPEYAVCL